MSARTPRFGFNAFGGAVTGALADDAMKFTYADRMLLDRLLAALEANDYRGSTVTVSDPVGAPTATVLEDAGVLRAGKTYYYVVSFVDQDGLETLVGDETSATTPASLAPPDPPQLESAAGGSLTPGQYYYALTGIRGEEESTLSGVATGTVIIGEGTMNLTLPDLGDATSLQVWRRGFTEGGFTRVGTTSSTAFTDDGTVPADACACDPNNQPPTSNRGISTYAVEVGLNVDDAAAVGHPSVRAWRVYRTESSGSYAANSLVHETVETVDEFDPNSGLVTSWIDDGDPLISGRPTDTSQRLHLRPFTLDRAAVRPAAAGYPEDYPLLVGDALYVVRDSAWVQVAGGGSGGPTVMTGADGRRWIQSVDENGTLVMTETDAPGAPLAPIDFEVMS